MNCTCGHPEHAGTCMALVFHCYQCDWERCGCLLFVECGVTTK